MSKTLLRQSLFTAEQILEVTGAVLIQRGSLEMREAVTDSRAAGPGSLFFPLPGSRTDGHLYLEDALSRGAAGFVAASSQSRRVEGSPLELAKRSGAWGFFVADPLKALQDLAAYHLGRLKGVLRIGITGSNGKTTTKEILGSILGQEGNAAVNEGNLNSEIGLPLAALRVREDHRYAVFEMGINHPGEMDLLAGMVRPELALITNIGSAHIGFLGSREAIAREKRKIFNAFSGREKAFLHEDEEFFDYLAAGARGKVIAFGPRTTPGYRWSETLGLDGTTVHWEGLQVRFPLFGAHNLVNALAAVSVSVELGINKNKIKMGLESVRPLFGRSQILKGPVTVLLDCYNSNPDSVAQVLDFMRALEWRGRKVAILGSMLELGEQEADGHRRTGRLAAHSGLDALLLFGAEMEPASETLKGEGFPGFSAWTDDFDTLRAWVRDLIRPGDLVLLKGSRGVELERLLPILQGSGGGVCC